MKARGIEVRTFFDVGRIDPKAHMIHAIEGDTIEYDLLIIIPPFAGTGIAFEAADTVGADGFIVTDKLSLRVKEVESAFAVDDATNLPTARSGVCAHLEAKVVASERCMIQHRDPWRRRCSASSKVSRPTSSRSKPRAR
jgi:sulfide:quinone oxidoreductase